MIDTTAVPHGLPQHRDAGPFDPPSEITRLRATRPVSPLKFPDGHDGWLVTGYEAVRRLMADPTDPAAMQAFTAAADALIEG